MGRRPYIKAETLHIDDLVGRALRGRIRVPRFQRGLKWRASDVQKLFDSIHRGFPIGTLLMWKRPATRAEVRFGPVCIQADETEDAWWVIDGQQRITSLVAGLQHPDPADPDDPFVVYYDLKPPEDKPHFFRPNRLRSPTPYCIPLVHFFDVTTLQEWLFDLMQKTGDRGYNEQAFDVATRIRNYRVPVYVVETEDERVAREIFVRINDSGRRMAAHEVFTALAPVSVPLDRGPAAIAARLSGILGEIAPNVVTKVARALVSNDVTGGASPKVTNHERWMEDTEKALDEALQFLRQCKVLHTRLLPARLTPLVTLARFFSRHPEPSERNLRLLRRWLWRGFFGEALGSDAKTLRRAVVAVTDDEDASVQALLAQVPRHPQAPPLPAVFDARNGMARLAALVMALQHPADPTSDERGDVFAWLEEHGAKVFARFPRAALRSHHRNGPATRFISPGISGARMRLQLGLWAKHDLNHHALQSHLVTPDAARALLASNHDAFISRRTRALQDAANALFKAMAEPEHSDRPPLPRVTL